MSCPDNIYHIYWWMLFQDFYTVGNLSVNREGRIRLKAIGERSEIKNFAAHQWEGPYFFDSMWINNQFEIYKFTFFDMSKILSILFSMF